MKWVGAPHKVNTEYSVWIVWPTGSAAMSGRHGNASAQEYHMVKGGEKMNDIEEEEPPPPSEANSVSRT